MLVEAHQLEELADKRQAAMGGQFVGKSDDAEIVHELSWSHHPEGGGIKPARALQCKPWQLICRGQVTDSGISNRIGGNSNVKSHVLFLVLS